MMCILLVLATVIIMWRIGIVIIACVWMEVCFPGYFWQNQVFEQAEIVANDFIKGAMALEAEIKVEHL